MAHAELSSLSSSLDELTKRVSALADSYGAQGTEEKARDLYGIERSLATAVRKLAKLSQRSATT